MPSWTQRTKQNLGQVSMPEMSSKSVTVTRQKGESKIYQEVIIDGKVDTAIKAFDFAVNKFKQVQCLGSREVLKEHSEMQNDGKVMKKLQLSDYKWKTYQEVQSKAKSFGRGLRSLGLQSGSGIAIYAETRAEWMISCLGAFTQVSLKTKKSVNTIIITIFYRTYTSVLFIPTWAMMQSFMQLMKQKYSTSSLLKNCYQSLKNCYHTYHSSRP